MAFSTNIKETQHLQGNVQVYNVRIPVPEASSSFPTGSPRFREDLIALNCSIAACGCAGSWRRGLLLPGPQGGASERRPDTRWDTLPGVSLGLGNRHILPENTGVEAREQ